jgi:hypothetical protein
MSCGDLKILSSCKRLIGEVEGYCWDPRAAEIGEDKPLKRGDHLCDSLRYSIFSYFGDKIFMKDVQDSGRPLGQGMLQEHMGADYPGAKQFNTHEFGRNIQPQGARTF